MLHHKSDLHNYEGQIFLLKKKLSGNSQATAMHLEHQILSVL